jgi:hypothetical protein
VAILRYNRCWVILLEITVCSKYSCQRPIRVFKVGLDRLAAIKRFREIYLSKKKKKKVQGNLGFKGFKRCERRGMMVGL